jgi:hypothetical protein
MKYLKLYEAFESNILSKTLKYLSKKSKESFLKEVKQICDEMDFPYSKLSDEYFEYLPFNNALKKIDGTNKIYKFWLNSDGDLINTTLTDGEILKQKYTSGDSIGEDNDYVGVGKIYTRYGELDELEDRSKIIILFRGDSKPSLATLLDDNGDYFAIHDNRSFDGGTPDYHDYDEWSEYGEYPWSLRGTDFHKIQLAVHIDSIGDGEKEGEIDYYSYNKKYKPENKKDGNPSSRKFLNGSEFAILFNTSKISNFEPKSKIQSTRKEMKSGAQALRDPEDIRKSNLERRLMEIAKKEFNINTFNELFNKILFDKYILFFNLDDTLKSIDQIIKLWENRDSDDILSDDSHMNALKKWYDTLTDTTSPNRGEVNSFFGREASKSSREMGAKLTLQHYGKITEGDINTKVTNTIFNTIKRLYNLRTDLLSKEATKMPNCKLLSNKLQELGQLIINKVKPSTFEDIDDIVIAQEKLNSISRILLSNRYEFKKSHDTIIYWAKGLSGNDDVDRHVLEDLLNTLNQMIKLVSKL